MPRRNLLILSNYAQMYGAETSLFETLSVLCHFRATVVLSQSGPFQTLLEGRGIRVIIYNFFQPRQRITVAARLAVLERIIERYSIDIIHLNKCYPRDFDFLKAARTMTFARCVAMTVHIRSRYDYTFEHKAFLSTLDKIICVSAQMKNELFAPPCPTELTQEDRLIEIIPNGRELRRYAFSATKRRNYRQRFKIGENELVIGLIGYFKRIKGQDRLVEFARRFKYCANIRFLLIGNLITNHIEYASNLAYYQGIMERIRHYRLEEKVILAGYIDACEVLSALDIVVNLSDHEGLPGVIMEAMAAERCVIANGVGGIPEMIDDQTGFCIEPNNLDQMQHLIDHLHRDRDRMRIIGKKSRERAEVLFDIKKHGERIEAIFDALVARTH